MMAINREMDLEGVLKEISNCDVIINETQSKMMELQQTVQKYKLRKAQLEKKHSLMMITHFDKELSRKYLANDFTWSTRLKETSKAVFSIETFRFDQVTAMNVLLSSKDLILVMPTGGGKSLCFQLPAVISRGLTLVVAPLLSLIEDQLYRVSKLNVVAKSMSSNTSKEDKKLVYDYMGKNMGSTIKLLYVTPEWLSKSKLFKSNLQKCHSHGNLDRIVIDEVHCCSKWGHDFRPDYQFLSLLKDMFENVPIMGLTATATTEVLLDVQKMLNIKGCIVLKSPLNRSNLFYQVVPKPSKETDAVQNLTRLLKTKYENQSGIIYVSTIKDAETLAASLRESGIRTRPYHAQLSDDTRRSVHTKWLQNLYQVVVATVAFGMGIDKSDVRYVIHYVIPRSMESMYQESGRAGRDGESADCLLMFRLHDFFKVIAMTNSKSEEEKLLSMLGYCTDRMQCRRKQIALHFEEQFDRNSCKGMCDNCKDSGRYVKEYSIGQACKFISEAIETTLAKEGNLTLHKLFDMWSKVKVADLLRDFKHRESIVAHLLQNKMLRIHKNYTAYQTYCYLHTNPAFDLKSESSNNLTMPLIVEHGKRESYSDLTAATASKRSKEMK